MTLPSLFLYYLKRPLHLIKTGLLEGAVTEAKLKYPARRLRIYAITGTDGKTTSSTLFYHVLKAAGHKVALITTVAAYIGDTEIDTGFHVTTPSPKLLHQFLRQMVEQGVEELVLETTSQGIYQYRTWGIHPQMVGITNITPEHLDYHVTYDEYLHAKAMLARQAPVVVLNADDEHSFTKLKQEVARTAQTVLTYSLTDALPPVVTRAIKTRFHESYNQQNARLVFTMATALGVPAPTIAKAITAFPGVSGRMEQLGSRRGIEVVVDFAHTANGLLEALTTLRAEIKKRKHGRLIAVFGCAGLRDRRKRPIMGRTGAELADFAIFTAEDPRTEDIWSIIRQMKSDLGTYHHKVISIPDRREAIFFAIQKLARAGDIVGIFGKGHEKSMCWGTVEYPWSDQEAAREALGLTRKSPGLTKQQKKNV